MPGRWSAKGARKTLFSTAALLGLIAGAAAAGVSPAQDLPGSEIVRPIGLAEIQAAIPDMPPMIRLLLPADYEANIPEFAKAAAKNQRYVSGLHGMMYDAINRVMASNLPADQRAQLGLAMSERFAEALAEIRAAPGVSRGNRAAITRTIERYLEDGNLVVELARERELGALVPQTGDAGEKTAATDGWKIPERRLPRLKKGTHVYRLNYDELERKLKEKTFATEKAQRRLELARTRSFSPALVGKLSRDYRRESKALESLRETIEKELPQSSNSRLREHFIFAPPDDAAEVPPPVPRPSSALRVKRDGGGYALEARLQTTIQEPAVLDTIRHSIEDYWRGEVREDGKMIPFRSKVTVEAIAPGQAFSKGALRVEEGDATYAQGKRMFLSRSLGFSDVAHEFGHLLGLPDEYTWSFEPRTRTQVGKQDKSSLMASVGGLVQERHLRAVVDSLLQRD